MSEAPRAQIVLPKDVISFDIETEMVADWRNREATPILFIGWKRYTFNGELGWYDQSVPYRWLPAERLSQNFFDQMNNFAGLIIGHNLIDFDYRVLWNHGDFQDIISRTCDTLALLRENHRGKGLKLDDLARVNFDDHKSCTAQEAINYYKDPDRRYLALQYNEQDCVLVFRVWEKLVRQQVIDIDAGGYHKTIRLTVPQLEKLVGMQPQLTKEAFLGKYPRLATSHRGLAI